MCYSKFHSLERVFTSREDTHGSLTAWSLIATQLNTKWTLLYPGQYSSIKSPRKYEYNL